MSKKSISVPALKRLCTLFRLLEKLSVSGKDIASSVELGKMLGVPASNIRKDINFLGEVGTSGAGYDVLRLREIIGKELGLNRNRNVCVVGLGRLGSAIMEYWCSTKSGFTVVAGFDSDINKLDTIKTNIPVYPSYKIADIVMEKRIELGVIAVPPKSAMETAHRLIEGGVKGIVNFSSAIIKTHKKDVHISNMDVNNEFITLSALISRDDF